MVTGFWIYLVCGEAALQTAALSSVILVTPHVANQLHLLRVSIEVVMIVCG